MAEARVYARLENERAVLRKLREIEDSVLKEKVYDAIYKGGELVVDEAKRRAPVLTGRLRASIQIKGNGKRQVRNGVIVEADYPANAGTRKSKTRKQKAGAKEYYAFALEYGTRYMPAQPFLNPALEAKAGEIQAGVAQALEELCRETQRVL